MEGTITVEAVGDFTVSRLPAARTLQQPCLAAVAAGRAHAALVGEEIGPQAPVRVKVASSASAAFSSNTPSA